MTEDILMPSMGEGINEATLVKWLKKAGDTVREDEPLLEVSTDKVDTELPSPVSGKILKFLYKDGDVITVHSVIAQVEVTGESKAKTPAVEKSDSSAPISSGGTAPQAAQPKYEINVGTAKASPLVRKMARDQSVKLDEVPGSGLGGRITKQDMIRYVNGDALGHVAQVPPYSNDNPIFKLQTELQGNQELLDNVPVRREKMSKMRSLIAEHMNRSIRVSPHVTTNFEIDMHNIVSHRTATKAEFEKKHHFKLTYTHYILYAAVQAIKEHPIVNVSIDGDEILFKDQINIGVAVAIESGLIVPVVKNSQNLSFEEMAKAIDELVFKARNKKLAPTDVRGGTFSVTNPGLYGSISSNPIINQPQVAILGVGQIVERPVAREGKVVIHPMMMISLTFDHRVVDGEAGAKYLATLKKILEEKSGF